MPTNDSETLMNVIGLDYETFYKDSSKKEKSYSVRTLGNWRYCHDEQFDAFLLGVHDGANSWCGHPKDFNWDAIDPSDLLIAHNAAFDSSVTRRLAELGLAPNLTNEWQCTANMTSYLAQTRSLAGAMWVLEKQKLSKEARDFMNNKHWDDVVRAGKADECAKYCLGDTVSCWDLFKKYGSQWPTFEQDLSRLTMKQCARGVAINIPLLEEYRAIMQEVIFNLIESFPWTCKGAKPTSPIAINEECLACGIPCPPTKEEDEDGFYLWESTYGPIYPWVYGAGQVRKLKKLLASLETIRNRLRPDGTIDFSLLYFGAHTGRWSGGGSGLNFQNFRKIPLFLKNKHMVTPPDGLKAKEFKAWVAANTDYALDIRKLIIARPGKKFILCDLSQIEPRVLAWLTGNTQLLEMLKSGMSIYEAFARQNMGWTGGELKHENPDMYQMAKIQVLGLGYGCGWEKFIAIAAGYDVILTEEHSKQIVTDFRKSNQKICGRGPSYDGERADEVTGIWKALDNVLRESVNHNFDIELPNGRKLNYRDVRRATRLKKNADGKMEKRMVFTAAVGEDREEFYGGLLTENLVQAASRDVFGTHLLQLEENFGDVIFHVHDEAITEVDMDVTVKDVEHCMSQCPEWIEGLPVGAEGKESQHYLK